MKRPDAPKALIFDLGKVLIDFSVTRACEQVGGVAGISAKDVETFLFADGLEFEFERGSIDFNTLHRKFESRFGRTISADHLRSAASDIFTPNQDTLSLLSDLHSAHSGQLKFILLSNTNEIHWDHIERHHNISRWFHDTILSFEVKAMKPEEKIYRTAIAASGVDADRCFFVDDVPENVSGARRVGIDAVVFESCEQLRDELARRGIGA